MSHTLVKELCHLSVVVIQCFVFITIFFIAREQSGKMDEKLYRILWSIGEYFMALFAVISLAELGMSAYFIGIRFF